MEYGLSSATQTRLKLSSALPAGEETDFRRCFEVHFTQEFGRKILLIVHVSSRYCIFCTNLKPFVWKDFSGFLTGMIRDALAREGFSEEEIRIFFEKAGTPQMTKSHGRKAMGGMNRILSELIYYPCRLQEGIYQEEYSRFANDRICRGSIHPERRFWVPVELFREEVRGLIEGQ